MKSNTTGYEFGTTIFDTVVSVMWVSSRAYSGASFLICRYPNSFGIKHEFVSAIFWIIVLAFFVRIPSAGTVNVTPYSALDPKGTRSD